METLSYSFSVPIRTKSSYLRSEVKLVKSITAGLLFLMFAVCITYSQSAGKPVPIGPAAELEKLSTAWMDAMVRHDRPALEGMMAPEYALRNWDNAKQSFPRDAWLDNLFNHIKIEKFEQKAISANVYGDVGVVTSKYVWVGSFDGKGFDSKGYCTDVFVKGPSGWKVVSRTSGGIPGSKLIDGTLSVW